MSLPRSSVPLEQYTRSNPDNAPARFVLAYLYLTEGQNPAAIEQLKIVTKLQPQDHVSAQLLQSMTQAQPAAAPISNPTGPAQEGQLAGTWTASPGAGSTITLNIAADNTFTWTVNAGGKSHEIAGQSTYGSGVLTLVQGESGPPMVGEVTWQDPDHFVFQALGGGPADKGLTFGRSS